MPTPTKVRLDAMKHESKTSLDNIVKRLSSYNFKCPGNMERTRQHRLLHSYYYLLLLLLLLLLLCPMFHGRRGNAGNLSPIIRWQPATSDFKIFQGLFGASLLIPAALSFRALPIMIPIYRMGC